MGWALRAIEDPAVLEERVQRLDDLQTLLASNRTQRFAYAERLAKRDSTTIQDVLNEWLLFWRDVARLSGSESNTTDALNTDYRAMAVRLAKSMDIRTATAMLSALGETMQNMDRNVNARLALDVLMLKMPIVLPNTATNLQAVSG